MNKADDLANLADLKFFLTLIAKKRESGEKAVILGDTLFKGKCVAEYCYYDCSKCDNLRCLGCGTNGKQCGRIKRGNSESKAKTAFFDFLEEYNANKSLR